MPRRIVWIHPVRRVTGKRFDDRSPFSSDLSPERVQCGMVSTDELQLQCGQARTDRSAQLRRCQRTLGRDGLDAGYEAVEAGRGEIRRSVECELPVAPQLPGRLDQIIELRPYPGRQAPRPALPLVQDVQGAEPDVRPADVVGGQVVAPRSSHLDPCASDAG